jgi:16S rRNA (cytidine1402-2'-O)-methyltransferase
MSGTLFVVATPIGNLEDITLRALRVLREVDVIAAEDTRRTSKLLTHYGIATRTVSFHAHNTKRRLPELLNRLRAETSVAIVSDAGTPGISDPGEDLIRVCVDEGIRVEPVPGVSAPITAIVASGFPMLPLTLFGFPPRRSKDRISWWSSISEIGHTVTFFESPHRVRATLDDGADVIGERPIMVARELTKLHQEFIHGTCRELAARLVEVRGETTVVIGPNIYPVADAPGVPSESEVAAQFWAKTRNHQRTRRQAISELAHKFSLSSKQVYAIVERFKNSGE